MTDYLAWLLFIKIVNTFVKYFTNNETRYSACIFLFTYNNTCHWRKYTRHAQSKYYSKDKLLNVCFVVNTLHLWYLEQKASYQLFLMTANNLSRYETEHRAQCTPLIAQRISMNQSTRAQCILRMQKNIRIPNTIRIVNLIYKYLFVLIKYAYRA